MDESSRAQWGERQEPFDSPSTRSGQIPSEVEGERLWAMWCHLSALSGYLVPFGNFIGPLIVWLVKKERSAFIDDQGKESLNFQLSLLIYALLSALLIVVLVGFVLLIGLGVAALVLIIVAAVKANSGERYRYPLTIRFIR